MITAAAFDRLADLPVNDPAGDMTPYLDLSKARRPGREVQRVNVDFPVDLLRAIDREARRIGVTRLHLFAVRCRAGAAAGVQRSRAVERRPVHGDRPRRSGTGEAEPQAARAAAHYYSGPHDRGTMAP